jgi:hypothetical protein
MTATVWIDGRDGLSVGDAGFLVHISNAIKHSERYELRNRPPQMNQSHKPCPRGWCGSWNDVSTDGLGVWRVVKLANNGRVQIAEVTTRDELVAFLDEHGYPDLLDECLEI